MSARVKPVAKRKAVARRADAYKLYKLALRCRAKAIGRECNDPPFYSECVPDTYRNTFLFLARELIKQGWKPKAWEVKL